MSSYDGCKAALLELEAVDRILDAMHVHFPDPSFTAVGCRTLCVVSRGLDPDAGQLPYAIKVTARGR